MQDAFDTHALVIDRKEDDVGTVCCRDIRVRIVRYFFNALLLPRRA